MKEDFAYNKDKKIKVIAKHFAAIMQELGLDLKRDSLKDTPARVARMYVDDFFTSLDKKEPPKVSTFANEFQYSQMLVQRNIRIVSICEHHFLPITGYAHLAYIPQDKVIGLSKINRLIDYVCRRPHLQERITQQIFCLFSDLLEIQDIAVLVEANHACVSVRGVCGEQSKTTTTAYGGVFLAETSKREEFLRLLQREYTPTSSS